MADNPLPETRHWEFRNVETGEVRKYAQRELTIDGEIQLIGLVTTTTQRLAERDFPWDDARAVLSDFEAKGIENADWVGITRLATHAIHEVPELASEVACILLGIFPTDENGNRNPKFDEELRHIRGSLKIERLVEMLKVFAEQNDYKRLAAPFVKALRRIWDEVGTSMTSDNSPTSAPASASPKA